MNNKEKGNGRLVARSGLKQKEQIQFYKSFFASMECVLFIYDVASNNLLWINDYHKKVIGEKLSLGEIQPETIKKYFHQDDIELYDEVKSYFEKKKRGSYSCFHKIVSSDGESKWVYTNLKIFRKTSDNKTIELLGFSVDFSNDLNNNKHTNKVLKEKLKKANVKVIDIISKRELEVIKFFANGYKTKEIAEELDISFHTVNNHRKNILKKLDLRNIAAMVNFAVENGLH